MTNSDKLQTWVDQLTRIDELTRNLSSELTALAGVPQVNVSPDALASTVTELWHTLGFGDPGRGPAHKDAAEVMEARLQGALGTATAWFSLALNLDAALTNALGRGAKHPELVCTADFGGSLVKYESDDGAGGTRVVFVAPLSSLPSDHPLRTALPPDDYFRAELGEPALVLGASLPGGKLHDAKPRAWYFKTSVLGVTRGWRLEQRKKEQDVKDREALEKMERLRAYQESPAGREAQLRAQLKDMEARLAATGAGGF